MARTGAAPQTGTRRIISLSGRNKLWQRRDDLVHHCDVQSDPDTLPNDPILLQQMLRELSAENDKLRLLIQRFTRHQFGRRSEQLTPDQLQFGLEDQEQTVAEHQAAQDAAEAAGGGQPKPRPRRGRPAIMVPCRRICRATRW